MKRVMKGVMRGVMKGGSMPRKIDMYSQLVTYQTIGECIKELIEASRQYIAFCMKRDI